MMELSRIALDLACEFNDALASGESPCIRSFLSRSSNEQERHQLLVQLLASELGYSTFDKARINACFEEFPELTDEQQIEVLRLVFNDRAIAHDELAWECFAQFGFSSEKLCLRVGDERNYVGERISGLYELESRIGAGRFGVVFRALDTFQRRPVAIKAPHYPKKPELAGGMLSHEAEVAKGLKHQHIVPLLDFFHGKDDVPYLVMEYIAGGSLFRLTKQAPIDPILAARILAQVADALAFAHRNAIFHRDVKPENILLDGDAKAYVSDFGFALSMEGQWNKEGEVAGTFAYMAPELLLGEAHKVDGRSDIWSVGMILYELLTNSRIAHESTREASLVAAIVSGERNLEFPDAVPLELRRICSRCLQRDPNRRFNSAGRLAEALRRAIAQVGTPASATLPTERTDTRSSLNAWRLGVKLGGCRKELRQCLQVIESNLPHLPHSDEKLPSKVKATSQIAVARETRAGNLYRESSAPASQLGLEVPPLPDEHGRHFYKAKKLTAEFIKNLPPSISEFEQILDSAILAARTALPQLGEPPISLFELASNAANLLPGETTEQLLDVTKGSGLPRSLIAAFCGVVNQAQDDGVIQYAFNQLDKKVERILSAEP